MEDKKFITKIIHKSVMVSILAIIIISIINIIPNPIVPHNNDWIPFYGSFVGSIMSGIIAGLLTYEGVRKTIQYTDKTRIDDFRKTIMPFFQVMIKGTGGELRKNNYEIENSGENLADDKQDYNIRVAFKNIGMKPAINIMFKQDLLSNALNVNDESKEITLKVKVDESNDDAVNCFNFSIQFQNLSGIEYIQNYEIKFEGPVKLAEIIPFNTLPRIKKL